MLLLACCQACMHLPWLMKDDGPALPAHTFHFRDGGEAIYFSLDKSLEDSPRANNKQVIDKHAIDKHAIDKHAIDKHAIDNYLFVVGGSDCTSMRYFLPQYFRGLEGESGSLRIFVLHKRFIQAHTWGRFAGCGEEFIRADHPRRWIADQSEFIRTQLNLARQQGRAPRRIVIVGISEGGDIVPALAKEIDGVTHAVILANGGMDPIEAYRLQAKKHGLAIEAVLSAVKQPPNDPDAVDHALGGRTWRYWSELAQLRHGQTLENLQIPILIAMGEDDRMVPIESAWRVRDRFAALGKTNLTLLTYPGADHGLVTAAGSRLPQFWHAMDRWLAN